MSSPWTSAQISRFVRCVSLSLSPLPAFRATSRTGDRILGRPQLVPRRSRSNEEAGRAPPALNVCAARAIAAAAPRFTVGEHQRAHYGIGGLGILPCRPDLGPVRLR